MLDAGTYALTFAGQNPAGGDNTAFLDAVALAFTPSGGGSGNGLADDPFGYLGGLGYWQDPGLSVSGLAGSAGAGLSYVRQRWLENATGQWLSVDPVATEPRYGYAHNMPIMRVDTSGTQTRAGQAPDINIFGIPVPLQSAYRLYVSAMELLRSLAQSPDKLYEHLTASTESLWRTFVEFDARADEAMGISLSRQDIMNLSPIGFPVSMWDLYVSQFPTQVQFLFPPDIQSTDFIRWEGGVAWGAVDFFNDLVKTGLHVFSFLSDPFVAGADIGSGFAAIVNVINFLVHYNWANTTHDIGLLFQGFMAKLSGMQNLSPYDKGKIVGKLLVNVASLFVGVGEIVDLIGALKAARLLAAVAPELAFAADAGKGEGWLARMCRAVFKRGLKEDKVASPEDTRKAVKIANELGNAKPAQDAIPLDARLSEIFSVLAGTAEEQAIVIRSLTAAARALGRSLPDLVEHVYIERGTGYARFFVADSGNPIISVDPAFFGSTIRGTANNPISQEMIAIHEAIHAEDYLPIARSNGGRVPAAKKAWEAYKAQHYPTEESKSVLEIRVQHEAWMRLVAEHGIENIPQSTKALNVEYIQSNIKYILGIDDM